MTLTYYITYTVERL